MDHIKLPPKSAFMTTTSAIAISEFLKNNPFTQRETGDWLDEKLNLDDRVGIDTVTVHPGVEFDAFGNDLSYRWIRDARSWLENPPPQGPAMKSLLRMQLLYMAAEKMGTPIRWNGMDEVYHD